MYIFKNYMKYIFSEKNQPLISRHISNPLILCYIRSRTPCNRVRVCCSYHIGLRNRTQQQPGRSKLSLPTLSCERTMTTSTRTPNRITLRGTRTFVRRCCDFNICHAHVCDGFDGRVCVCVCSRLVRIASK